MYQNRKSMETEICLQIENTRKLKYAYSFLAHVQVSCWLKKIFIFLLKTTLEENGQAINENLINNFY